MKYKSYDVICVGGGGAGISAAIAASSKRTKVALLTKGLLGQGNTYIAGGTVACPGLDKTDTPSQFAEDIIRAGGGIADKYLASILAVEAFSAMKILESFGLIFKKNIQGRRSTFVVRRLGGHSYARSLVSPARGCAISSVIRAAAVKAGVDIYEETLVAKILIENKLVQGLICFSLKEGTFFFIQAPSIVLATGGACWLYYPHTNSFSSSTGDGYALALNAGAELIDMEQIQFSAFGITHPESMTGQGLSDSSYGGPLARLLNKSGKIVLQKFSYMTRDEITRVVAEEMQKGGSTEFGGLKLDLSLNLQSEEAKKILIEMQKTGSYDHIKMAYGDDAYNFKKPWDIAPSAHYMMGGVKTDLSGETKVKGIYVAGEVQGGIHGSNRLGSVALAEIFVFGKRSGENAAYKALHEKNFNKVLSQNKIKEEIEKFVKLFEVKGNFSPIKLKRTLQKIMWKKVGVIRQKKQLMEAMDEINELQEKISNIKISSNMFYNLDVADAIELQFMLSTAKAIVLSALIRKETRGSHMRLDYPYESEELSAKRTTIFIDNGQIKAKMTSV